MFQEVSVGSAPLCSSRSCILLSILANGYRSVSVDAEWPWYNFEQSHPYLGLRTLSHIMVFYFFFSQGATAHSGPSPHYRSFTTTFRHKILVRTPLEERSACRREIFRTKHNTPNRERECHPCRRRISNPQTQKFSGRQPTS